LELVPAIHCNPRPKAWDFHYYLPVGRQVWARASDVLINFEY